MARLMHSFRASHPQFGPDSHVEITIEAASLHSDNHGKCAGCLRNRIHKLESMGFRDIELDRSALLADSGDAECFCGCLQNGSIG